MVHHYSHPLTLAIMVVLRGIDTRMHCNNEVIECKVTQYVTAKRLDLHCENGVLPVI